MVFMLYNNPSEMGETYPKQYSSRDGFPLMDELYGKNITGETSTHSNL